MSLLCQSLLHPLEQFCCLFTFQKGMRSQRRGLFHGQIAGRLRLLFHFAAFEKLAMQYWSSSGFTSNETFGLPPPLAGHQVRTEGKPLQGYATPTDVTHPMKCATLGPLCSAWRWRQRSTLAFGAKTSFLLSTLVSRVFCVQLMDAMGKFLCSCRQFETDVRRGIRRTGTVPYLGCVASMS